jgi:hypothetical protein
LAAAVCQKAEEADANKSMRKHMEKKPSQELLRGYGHQLLLVAMRVIFPPERDLVVFQSHESMVGDSNPMRVARQIMQNMLRPSEGWFDIDNPVVSIKRPEERTEGWPLGQWLKNA